MKCNQYRPGFELVSPSSFPRKYDRSSKNNVYLYTLFLLTSIVLSSLYNNKYCYFNHTSMIHQGGLQWCAVFIADFGLFLHHIGSDSNLGITLKEPSRLRDRDVLRSCLYQSKEKKYMYIRTQRHIYIYIYTHTHKHIYIYIYTQTYIFQSYILDASGRCSVMCCLHCRFRVISAPYRLRQ